VGQQAETELLAGVPDTLFIGGKWQPAMSGKTFPVENPATGETLVTVADAGADDAASALDAAVEWAATAPRARGEILRQAFELVMQHRDEVALLMTLEMGKPLSESSKASSNLTLRTEAKRNK
jgi:succinate-semialdehyde dehydrogenase/glutarate-semialdehyde dehydrogenase